MPLTRHLPADVVRHRSPDLTGDAPAADTHAAAACRGAARRFLPAAFVFVLVVAALLSTGTAVVDVLRYLGYATWALALPGTLLYRALRGVPRSFVDDLAFGTVLGFALEIPVWAVYAALDAQRWLVTWPLIVVASFVAAPALRRHWRAPRYPQPPPLAWSWTVAGIVSLVVGYVWLSYLRGPAPVPASGTHLYFWDLPYMLSLTAEAKHHFPLHQPQVAGEPLHYHWFTYAHEAAASLISGVDTPIVFYRLAIPLICVVAVVVLAVAGWRITGKYWVGAVAAALMFLVGELSPVFVGETFSNVFLVGVWRSHAQAYSWLALFPIVALVADRLAVARPARAHPHRPAWGRGGWVLLALMCFWASGARATILPVVLGGLGLAYVVGLVRRQLSWSSVAILAAVLAAQGFALVVLFGLEPSGFTADPAGTIGPFLGSSERRADWQDVIVAAFLLGAWTIYMLTRVAGAPVLGWLAWQDRRAGPAAENGVAPVRWAAPEWFLLGGLLAGVGATLVLKHPGWGQVIFVRTSFVCGALLSAAGAVALLERHRLSARAVAGCVVTAVLVALGVWALAPFVIGDGPRPAFHAAIPIATQAAVIGAVLGAGALAWPALRRRWPSRRGTGAVLALAVVLASGLCSTATDIAGTMRFGSAAYTGTAVVSADQVAAARWLRAHSDPDDVVAVNHACSVATPCSSRTDFWLEAYSERRQLLGSWLYAPRAITAAVQSGGGVGSGIFWDQQVQAANTAAFYAPTLELIEMLRQEHGVRWFVVDRSRGTESPLLRDLLILRYEQGRMAIYGVPAA